MDPLERRQLLLTAVGGSLLSLATAEPLSAQTAIKTPVDVPLKKIEPGKVIDLRIDSPKEAEAWNTIKSRVSESGVWPKVFDASFEESVFSQLERVASEETNKFTHNPRLVEPLLGEISSLLDRSLACRREGSELEIAGVAAGAARIVSDAVREIDQKLAAIDVTRSMTVVLAENYPAAADLYEQASDHNLGRGNASQIKAQVLANQKVTASVEERLKLTLGRLAFTQEVERQLLGRHDVPGNADNFGERFERLRKLFASDVVSAYRRALAASAGLAALFDFKDPLPTLAKNGFLDELVIWTRNAMRAVARVGESEIEFTRVISIPVAPATPAAPASINFDTSFPGFKMLRLRGIAACFCQDPGDVKNDNAGNASIGAVMVKTDGGLGPRVVIPLPSVRQFGAQREPVYVDGALIYNVDPRGNWSYRVSTKGIGGNGAAWERAALIKSLIVYMKLVGVPEEKDGSWWTTEDHV
jgi:hypothetical protein